MATIRVQNISVCPSFLKLQRHSQHVSERFTKWVRFLFNPKWSVYVSNPGLYFRQSCSLLVYCGYLRFVVFAVRPTSLALVRPAIGVNNVTARPGRPL